MSDAVYELWVRTNSEADWEQREVPESPTYGHFRALATKLLDDYDFVKVITVGGEERKTFTFWYAAFTDPLRGRQSVCTMAEEEAVAWIARIKEQFKCPTFSANELFEMKPDHVDFDSYQIIRFLSPYLGRVYADDIDNDAVDEEKRLEHRTLVFYVYDGGDNSWSVGTLWYRGVPFAVMQRSGEGDECYITNVTVLGEVIQWLLTFAKNTAEPPHIVNPNEKNWRLTEFCDRRLTEFYDVVKQEPLRCPVCCGYREERMGVPPYSSTSRCKNEWHEQFKS
jgi:hypothetical protein